jgi:asparagine synthase (glutamine-hydrolysing)
LGDLFDGDGDGALAREPEARVAGQPGASPRALARTLSSACWGRYLALLQGDGVVGAFRDPSGSHECLVWRLREGLDVVASELDRTPRWLWPPRMALNWDRVALHVTMMTATSEALFDGMIALCPGEFHELGAPRGAPDLIWRPADFVRPEAADAAAAASELVKRVDACTRGLAGRYDALIAELSGGLDSSIVAAALAEVGLAPRVACWLNRVGDRPEGDERAYARAVTDRLGVALTAVAKPLTPLDLEGFRETASGIWPAINGMDASRDRDALERLAATGAQAIISGEGGDAVFFQMPTALVWADAFRRAGPAALRSPVLADVARRTHQSVWSVLRAAIRDRRRRTGPSAAPSPFAAPALRRAAVGVAMHPWVRDAHGRDLPPAKRVQIEALANCQLFHRPSRRTAKADQLFPLLAQPVVELCLSIASPDLAGGSYDRPFARAAFASRLPACVLDRRAKGVMTGYFARLIAASRDVLRPYLLDGCLSEAGVLDRAAVAGALEPEQLMWTAGAGGLLAVTAVEAWVRYWQGRVPDCPAAPRHRRWT